MSGAPTPSGPSRSAQTRISKTTHKLALVSRQFMVLLDAGVPLVPALEVLGRQMDDRVLGAVLLEVAQTVSGGLPLSKALARFPRIFSKVFVGLVQSGEATGSLVAGLARLTETLEREADLQRRMSAALTYPTLVLVVTFLLTIVLFQTVLPGFVTIFKSMDIPLPLITRALIFLTDALKNPGCWAVAISGGLALYVLLQQWLSSPAGRLKAYQLLLAVPLIGKMFRYATLARYCWVMNCTLVSGVALLPSLRLAAEASASPVLEHYAEVACNAVRDGEPLSHHYSLHTDVYDRLLPQMILASEETRGMGETFSRLGSWFNEETQARLEMLSVSLEPLLMCVVALIVGTVVIAIFLPLYGYLATLA